MPAYRRRDYGREHAFDIFLIALVTGYAARLTYSIVSLHILESSFGWYYLAGYYVGLLSVPFMFHRVFLALEGKKFSMSMRFPRIIFAVTLLLVLITWRNPWIQYSTLSRPLSEVQATVNWSTASYEGVQWMNQNLPDAAVVGVPDSGIVGYFSRHRVINLDGLVNSFEYFKAMKAQKVDSWIRSAGITHLAGGMLADEKDCRQAIAFATFQRKPLSQECTLVYEGPVWSVHFGSQRMLRFRVYEISNNPAAGL